MKCGRITSAVPFLLAGGREPFRNVAHFRLLRVQSLLREEVVASSVAGIRTRGAHEVPADQPQLYQREQDLPWVPQRMRENFLMAKNNIESDPARDQ